MRSYVPTVGAWLAGTYRPNSSHGVALVSALDALREAQPFANHGEALSAARSGAIRSRMFVAYADGAHWVTALCVKGSRVRFDFVAAIRTCIRDHGPSTLDAVWEEAAAPSYGRSDAARLAFELQYLGLTTHDGRLREDVTRRGPRFRTFELPPDRAEQRDGPKRRRFRRRDRHDNANLPRWEQRKCRCDWCRSPENRTRRERIALAEAVADLHDDTVAAFPDHRDGDAEYDEWLDMQSYDPYHDDILDDLIDWED